MSLYSQITRSAEAGLDDLYLEVPITNTSGALGTPVRRQGFGAAYPANAASLAAITRTSPGLYVLNLDQRWQSLVDFTVLFADGTVAATDGFDVRSITRALNQAQPTVTFQLVQASGAAADPFAGSGSGSMIVHLTLKSSTV